MKDLDKEEGMKIVFDNDKFKKSLEDPLPFKMLKFQVIMYLCQNIPLNGRIPPLGKIANDLKVRIEEVREAIKDLKDCGLLEDK